MDEIAPGALSHFLTRLPAYLLTFPPARLRAPFSNLRFQIRESLAVDRRRSTLDSLSVLRLSIAPSYLQFKLGFLHRV